MQVPRNPSPPRYDVLPRLQQADRSEFACALQACARPRTRSHHHTQNWHDQITCKRNAYHTLKLKNPVFATVLICYGGVADLARLSTAERKRLGARGAFADVVKQSRLMAAKARETEFSQAQALARKVTAVEHVDDDDDDDAETAKGRGGAPESFDAIVPLRTWGSPLSQSRMLHPVEGKTQARN